MSIFLFFFFNDTATTEIYTLSLHDALPISSSRSRSSGSIPGRSAPCTSATSSRSTCAARAPRSEEHTSELQSPCNLVCRLLLEKKKNQHDSESNGMDRSRCRHSRVANGLHG